MALRTLSLDLPKRISRPLLHGEASLLNYNDLSMCKLLAYVVSTTVQPA